MVQARLASAEVAEQRQVWGMAYRQHVLETFQLARHNQQQRQALYIGTLRRQALCMTVGESRPSTDPQSPRRMPSLRMPSGLQSGTPRRGSPLRIASIPEAILAAQLAMGQHQSDRPPPAELQQAAEHERRAALPSPTAQPFVSPFATARRPSRLAAATSAAAAALQPPQRTSSDLAALAAGSGTLQRQPSATLQHLTALARGSGSGRLQTQPSPEALRSVRVVSGRLGALMHWDSERSRVASLPPAWATLARQSSMLSELHVG